MFLVPSLELEVKEREKIDKFLTLLNDSGVGEIINRYIKNNTSSGGRPGYSYYRLFATIIYGISFDRYTLRELEDACKYDLRYIYLMEQETPRHIKFCDLINKVIVPNEEEIFSLINLEIQKVTNIEFEDAFIDGTKYEAIANKYKFVWKPIKHHKNLSIKIGSSIKERGLVVSFDDEHIVIKYENEERTYCPDIAFKNKFLSFLDNSLNLSIYEDLSIKEELKLQHEKEAEANRKIVINRSKKINELYKKISSKNAALQSLFGRNFQYPPLIEFEKKYRCYITIRTNKYPGIIAETYGR